MHMRMRKLLISIFMHNRVKEERNSNLYCNLTIRCDLLSLELISKTYQQIFFKFCMFVLTLFIISLHCSCICIFLLFLSISYYYSSFLALSLVLPLFSSHTQHFFNPSFSPLLSSYSPCHSILLSLHCFILFLSFVITILPLFFPLRLFHGFFSLYTSFPF